MTPSELLDGLRGANRILIEARLEPLAGDRFQPTGFPEIGAAQYTGPDGTDMLLVESEQSVANRLEEVCWDWTSDDLVAELSGLPYVRVGISNDDPKVAARTTSSILEAHRVNSPYIIEDVDFRTALADAIGPDKADRRDIAAALLRYDPNSLVHGVFLEKIKGLTRLARLLSGSIEASDVRPVWSGGVKNDRIDPTGKVGAGAAEGFGNVPFSRTEFVAGAITGRFVFDLASLRSYALGDDAEALVIALALWKVRRLLDGGLRLRTACDLEVVDVEVLRPREGFELPSGDELGDVLRQAIAACGDAFNQPPVTELTWAKHVKVKPEDS